MDFFKDWLAIVLSVAAFVVSVLAYRRSSLADRRAHAHEDVRWTGSWKTLESGQCEFVLKNVGRTAAKQVWVEVWLGVAAPEGENPMVVQGLGTFKPGEERAIGKARESESAAAAAMFQRLMNQDGDPFTVHWVSPLGEPKAFDSPAAMQLS